MWFLFYVFDPELDIDLELVLVLVPNRLYIIVMSCASSLSGPL